MQLEQWGDVVLLQKRIREFYLEKDRKKNEKLHKRQPEDTDKRERVRGEYFGFFKVPFSFLA